MQVTDHIIYPPIVHPRRLYLDHGRQGGRVSQPRVPVAHYQPPPVLIHLIRRSLGSAWFRLLEEATEPSLQNGREGEGVGDFSRLHHGGELVGSHLAGFVDAFGGLDPAEASESG